MIHVNKFDGVSYTPGLDRLITKREAADILGVSVRTLEREVSAGKLPVHKLRGCVRLALSRVLRHAGIECGLTSPLV